MDLANTPLAKSLTGTTKDAPKTLKDLLEARNKKLGLEQPQQTQPVQLPMAPPVVVDPVVVQPPITPIVDSDSDKQTIPEWAKSFMEKVEKLIPTTTTDPVQITNKEGVVDAPRFVTSLIPRLCNDLKIPMANHDLVYMALDRELKDKLTTMDESALNQAITSTIQKYPSLMTLSHSPTISGNSNISPKKVEIKTSDEAREHLRDNLNKVK